MRSSGWCCAARQLQLGERPAETGRPSPAEAAAAAAPVPVEPTPDTAPRTGVEVIAVEERGDERSYTIRDLRNGNVVKNVTLKSARRLWHYAITAFDKLPKDIVHAKIQWQGNYGLVSRQKQGRGSRYDLVDRAGKPDPLLFRRHR